MIPNTAQEEDHYTRKRRLNIYKHLATQVGGVSAGDKKEYLCEVIVQQCMGKTPQNDKPSVVDCYNVWCEVNDIPLKDEGLGSLFADTIPTADEKLRQMFHQTYNKVRAEYREVERKRAWLQYKSLHNVMGLDQPYDSYKEYLESLGEE
jgi:hypothetical protein